MTGLAAIPDDHVPSEREAVAASAGDAYRQHFRDCDQCWATLRGEVICGVGDRLFRTWRQAIKVSLMPDG